MTDEKTARLTTIRAANTAESTGAHVPASVAVCPHPAQKALSTSASDAPDELPDRALQSTLLMLLAMAAGAIAAIMVLPGWLPGLSASLLGPEPKGYWYLARSSAFVAYGLLWLSMALGLSMTSKLARLWPGGPTAFDLHQHASVLGLAIALFHGLILLGDHYIGFTAAQVLIPFATASYKPLWVGLGQLAGYGMVLVGLSFALRRLLGRRAWRFIHSLSYIVFLLALLHGVVSGSDSSALWAQAIYWSSAGSLLFLTIYRVLAVQEPQIQRAARARSV